MAAAPCRLGLARTLYMYQFTIAKEKKAAESLYLQVWNDTLHSGLH